MNVCRLKGPHCTHLLVPLEVISRYIYTVVVAFIRKKTLKKINIYTHSFTHIHRDHSKYRIIHMMRASFLYYPYLPNV